MPLGDPYATVVFGEGRFCGSAGPDQWRIELHAYHAINNVALQQGGLGIWARLDTAYCNIFQPGMINGQWMNATQVAAACEWTLEGCVDAAGHLYGFHGCGRSKNCIREHIWSDVAHAALHVPVTPAKIAHLLYGGMFAPTQCPVAPDDASTDPGVYGFSTLANGECTGLGAEAFDGSTCMDGGSTEVFPDCGPGGNSVSRPGSSSIKAYTEAHEIAHSFDAVHLYGEKIEPSDPGCVETYTIMGGQIAGQSYDGAVDCKRREFSADNVTTVDSCRLNAWCPRQGFGP